MVEIIAEIAQGYEGNPKLSKLLVKGALSTDVDSIKMQLVYADELCVPTYPYYDLFSSLEMEIDVWEDIVYLIHKNKKKIYLDIYGNKSLSFARKLNVDGVKISTTDFYNFSLIKDSFNSFDTVILSCGGVPIEEIDQVINNYKLPRNLILMHGFQAEPTLIQDNNLNRIRSLISRYKNIKIGFMDHAKGDLDEAFYLSLVALGQGVSVIEKHITLDYNLKLEDYISALSIDRFKKFVKIIREMHNALGDPDFTLNKKELEYKNKAGKVVIIKKNIKKGEKILQKHITLKRYSTEYTKNHFYKLSDVIGKKINKNLNINQPIKKEDIL